MLFGVGMFRLGFATLALGLVILIVMRTIQGRRSNFTERQAKLDMLAAAIDPEYRKPE